MSNIIPKTTSLEQALSETTAVIVNYNSVDIIGECLRPLQGIHEVIVVDNGSEDDSVAMIERDFPDVRLIRAGSNLGNGAGLNLGAALAHTPYLLLIDPDAVLLPEELVKLYDAIKEYKDAAFITPTLYVPRHGRDVWVMGPNELQHHRGRFEAGGPFCSWFHAGTVMLFRTDVYRELGGFDDNIFLYCEDVDLCIRVHKAGYSMIALPDARAEHLNSRSTKPTVRLHWRKDWNFKWSFLYLTEKHRGRKAMRREAWKMFRKVGPKSLLYALTFSRKRFVRDFAGVHGILSYILGRPAPRPK